MLYSTCLKTKTKAKRAAGTFFKCKSGRTIDCSQINDDWCDCEGGEDEPGTSACSARIVALFSCADRSGRVPHSRVDDGIEDCADGSDEFR